MMLSYADVVRGRSQQNEENEEKKDNNQDSEPLYTDPDLKFQCGQIAGGKFVGQVANLYRGKVSLYNRHGIEVALIETSFSRGTVYVDLVSVDLHYRGLGIASKLVSSLSDQGISMEASCYYTSFGLCERLGFQNMGQPVSRGHDGHYSFQGARRNGNERERALHAPKARV